jgi:hypothetical protein
MKAGRNKAIQNIVDILERALKVSLEIKADSAGRYFRHIEPDLKLGNLHYRLNKDFDPFLGRSRASACVSARY